MLDASPIDKLRAIVAGLRSGEPIPLRLATWFGEAVDRYEAEAATGLKLDAALGLAVSPGGRSWWQRTAETRRDEALRELAAASFSGLPIRAQAREIAKAAGRYEASQWRFDRSQPSEANGAMPPTRRLLFLALKTGARIPRERRLREILSVGGELALLTAQHPPDNQFNIRTATTAEGVCK